MTIVSLEQYQEIYHSLSDKDSLQPTIERHSSVAPWTIQSIYRMKWQEILKKKMHVYQNPALVQQYYELYMKNRTLTTVSPSSVSQVQHENTMILMAKEYNLPSCLLCRLILRQVYLNAEQEREQALVTCRPVSESEPDAKPEDGSNGLEPRMKEFIKNCLHDPATHLPHDLLLAKHIQECLLEDDICSPLTEKIKHQQGNERENDLFQKLASLGISFIVENGMRDLGFPKTPDALLSVPVAIDGCVVNWIESKAFFGDPFQHQKYLKKQYWSYHNRFGPGLVIYWFGFVQEMDTLREQGILVRENFPDQVVQIRSELKLRA